MSLGNFTASQGGMEVAFLEVGLGACALGAKYTKNLMSSAALDLSFPRNQART